MNPPFQLLNFPVELFCKVLQFTSDQDQSSLLGTSKVFCEITRRRLFHSISLDLRPNRFELFVDISSNTQTADLVQDLSIHWQRRDTSGPSSMSLEEYGVPLKNCLRRLRNLESLALDLSHFDSFEYLERDDSPDPFPFRLLRFSTTLPCDSHQLAFVERQTTLSDLRLDTSAVCSDPSLRTREFPNVRVLRWGPEVNLEIVTHILLKTATINEVYVEFSEHASVKETLRTLLPYSFGGRAFFTIPSLEFLPEFSLGLPDLTDLSVYVHGIPELPNIMIKLNLGKYSSLRTLTVSLTESTWEIVVSQHPDYRASASTAWFGQCRYLDSIIFKDMKSVQSSWRTSSPVLSVVL